MALPYNCKRLSWVKNYRVTGTEPGLIDLNGSRPCRSQTAPAGQIPKSLASEYVLPTPCLVIIWDQPKLKRGNV